MGKAAPGVGGGVCRPLTAQPAAQPAAASRPLPTLRDVQALTPESEFSSFVTRGVAPEWSGIAKGCTYPHANPARDRMHTIERQAEQLAMAGINQVPAADYSWAEAGGLAAFALPEAYAVMAPGGAQHRPDKRWPADRFAAIAGPGPGGVGHCGWGWWLGWGRGGSAGGQTAVGTHPLAP